jgi:hypothetical protein
MDDCHFDYKQKIPFKKKTHLDNSLMSPLRFRKIIWVWIWSANHLTQSLISPLKIMWILDFGCGFGMQSPHPRLISPLKIMWILDFRCGFGMQSPHPRLI